jgi:hypothetical protein
VLAYGLRRTEFNLRGVERFHVAGRLAAKIEFCTSEPCRVSTLAELRDASGRLAARTTSAPGQPEQASCGALRDRLDRFSRCRRRARGQRLRCRSHGSRRRTGLRPCDGHQRSSKPLGHFRQVLGRSQQQGMSGVQQDRSSRRIDFRCHQAAFFDANCIEVKCHLSRPPKEVPSVPQPRNRAAASRANAQCNGCANSYHKPAYFARSIGVRSQAGS